jgi:hypothetical protein
MAGITLTPQSQQVKELENKFLALHSSAAPLFNVFLCKVTSATDEQRVEAGAYALTGSAPDPQMLSRPPTSLVAIRCIW